MRNANGPIYFGGVIDKPIEFPPDEGNRQDFLHYVTTVWINEHPVPTEPALLAKFDINALRPEYQAFIERGGKTPHRGASIEEYWLFTQLALRCPVRCLLNANQPYQKVARITRLERLSPAAILEELQKAYANPTLKNPGVCPFTTLVYDGAKVAHIIVAWTLQADELHFQDPWPDRSLLCAEHNSAGVAARISDRITPGWQITLPEFEKVVFAVNLYDPDNLNPLIELTEEESKAAKQQELLISMLRTINRAPPDHAQGMHIQGMHTISRLESAARLNRVWEVKVAINEGDAINAYGESGDTPLHAAAETGHLEITKLLVRYGADWHMVNKERKTAAEVARAKGNFAVAEYLESLG